MAILVKTVISVEAKPGITPLRTPMARSRQRARMMGASLSLDMANCTKIAPNRASNSNWRALTTISGNYWST